MGQGASFTIERCRNCHGSWLDRDEWQSLAGLGLATQLAHVFSDEWQRDIRQAEQRAAAERLFEQRLGSADLARARDFRDWLAGHPRRSELLAYLDLVPASRAAPSSER